MDLKHVIKDIIAYVRGWLPGAKPTRKRHSEDSDIPKLVKSPRLNTSSRLYPSVKDIEDRWNPTTSLRLPNVRRPFVIERPARIKKAPIVNPHKIKHPIKTRDKNNLPDSKQRSKFPFLNNFKRYGSSAAEFSFRLADRKRYEELIANSRRGLNTLGSFAESTTPLGTTVPVTQDQKKLHMACKNSKPVLPTKGKIIKVLEKMDCAEPVVKDKTIKVDCTKLPTPPSPKSEFDIKQVNSLKTVVDPSDPQHESWITDKIKKHEEAIAVHQREIDQASAKLKEIQEFKHELRRKQLADHLQSIKDIKKAVLSNEVEDKYPDITTDELVEEYNAIDNQRNLNDLLLEEIIPLTYRDLNDHLLPGVSRKKDRYDDTILIMPGHTPVTSPESINDDLLKDIIPCLTPNRVDNAIDCQGSLSDALLQEIIPGLTTDRVDYNSIDSEGSLMNDIQEIITPDRVDYNVIDSQRTLDDILLDEIIPVLTPRRVDYNAINRRGNMNDIFLEEIMPRLTPDQLDYNLIDRQRDLDGVLYAGRIPSVAPFCVDLVDSLNTILIDDTGISLTPEQEDVVNNALDTTKSLDTVLSSKFRLDIVRADILTLSGMHFLNDAVINFYMNLIIDRGQKIQFPTSYTFNTFFYPKVLAGGHSSVSRWTRKTDIFTYDMICVPVHMNSHWCMAVVNFRIKMIGYYDSMGRPNRQCIQTIARYLREEHYSRKKKEYVMAGWKFQCVKNIPQQQNGVDCGVFACTFAEYLTRDAEFDFHQRDMPYLRRKMVYEIISGKLLIS